MISLRQEGKIEQRVVNDFNARRLGNIYLINHARERMLMKRPRLNIPPPPQLINARSISKRN